MTLGATELNWTATNTSTTHITLELRPQRWANNPPGKEERRKKITFELFTETDATSCRT